MPTPKAFTLPADTKVTFKVARGKTSHVLQAWATYKGKNYGMELDLIPGESIPSAKEELKKSLLKFKYVEQK